jgi:hypothetical protein
MAVLGALALAADMVAQAPETSIAAGHRSRGPDSRSNASVIARRSAAAALSWRPGFTRAEVRTVIAAD